MSFNYRVWSFFAFMAICTAFNIEICMSYELSYNEVIKIEGFAVRQR